MRYSTKLLIFLIILMTSAVLEIVDYHNQQTVYQQEIQGRKLFQRQVGLPDLAITGSASYLRHYSISDMTTAFQDYPASLDHFPAGFVYAAPDYSEMPTTIFFDRIDTPSIENKKR